MATKRKRSEPVVLTAEELGMTGDAKVTLRPAKRKPARRKKRKCKGTNAAGKPCGASPLKGQEHCAAHDPNRPDADRFGSPEQAARAGASEKPRVPKLTEVLQRRVEAEAEAIVGALFEALTASRGITLRIGDGQDVLEMTPDHATRIAAARELFDRAIGRAKQQTEITGADGGPLQVEGVDLGQLTGEQLEQLETLLKAAAADGAAEPR